MMTDVRRLYVVLCGYEIIPKSVSTRDRGDRFVLAVPITAYLLDTAQGWVLFDTGLDERNLNDPEAKRRLFTDAGWDPAPVVRAHHELAPQLAAIGIGYADIKTVILSHLHADHTGHLKDLRHARIIVQRAEMEAALHGPDAFACFPSDYRDLDLNWSPVDGDHDLMPGLKLLATPGHTVGHMSARIDLPRTGPVLLAADVGDLQENFDEEILPGASVDDAAALGSIRRLKALQAQTGAMMLLTHDPDQVQRIRLAPEFYD